MTPNHVHTAVPLLPGRRSQPEGGGGGECSIKGMGERRVLCHNDHIVGVATHQVTAACLFIFIYLFIYLFHLFMFMTQMYLPKGSFQFSRGLIGEMLHFFFRRSSQWYSSYVLQRVVQVATNQALDQIRRETELRYPGKFPRLLSTLKDSEEGWDHYDVNGTEACTIIYSNLLNLFLESKNSFSGQVKKKSSILHRSRPARVGAGILVKQRNY